MLLDSVGIYPRPFWTSSPNKGLPHMGITVGMRITTRDFWEASPPTDLFSVNPKGSLKRRLRSKRGVVALDAAGLVREGKYVGENGSSALSATNMLHLSRRHGDSG